MLRGPLDAAPAFMYASIKLVLKFTPILIPIGLVWSWLGSAIRAPFPQYPTVQINESVRTWVTNWGIPDFPMVRSLLGGFLAGVQFLATVALIPVLKLGHAFGVDHLHRVSLWLAIAVMVVTGIATLV